MEEVLSNFVPVAERLQSVDVAVPLLPGVAVPRLQGRLHANREIQETPRQSLPPEEMCWRGRPVGGGRRISLLGF